MPSKETALAAAGIVAAIATGAVLISRAKAAPPEEPPPEPGEFKITIELFDRESNTRLSGVSMVILKRDETQVGSALTGVTGEVSFNLAPDGYFAVADKAGYNTMVQQFTVVDEPYTFSMSLLQKTQPPPAPTSGEILALVLDNVTSLQVIGAAVYADGARGILMNNGYLISPLVAGTYRIQVSASGYEPGEATATVIAGQTVNVTIRMQPITPAPTPSKPIVILNAYVSPDAVAEGETVSISASFKNVDAVSHRVLMVVQIQGPDGTPHGPFYSQILLSPNQQISPIWGFITPTSQPKGTYTVEFFAFSDFPSQGGFAIADPATTSFQVF